MKKIIDKTGLFRWILKSLRGIVLILVFGVTVFAQEKHSIQIKTFDQQLRPVGNIEVSINGKEFIPVNNRGLAMTELSDADFPIRTIQVKNDDIEAASWIYGKGVVEITVRKKSYQLISVLVRDADNQPIAGVKVTFKGKKVFTALTDKDGKVQVPLALNETINTVDQFSIPDFELKNLNSRNNEKILTAQKFQPPVEAQGLPQEIEKSPAPTREYFRHFDLSMLDSIQSLTVFYSVFKDLEIKEMDAKTRQRIDTKFNQLVQQLEDSVKQAGTTVYRSITDSTLVADDIRSLIEQVRGERTMLQDQRKEFDENIRMITNKLDAGVSSLSESTRAQLLSDLALLEKLLIENESMFFKNQNDYRQIINGIRDKYFDLHELENQLSVSEAQRLEEQRVFRERLILILAALLLFGFLILLLIKQRSKLSNANKVINRMNESLETQVFERTRMLAEAHRELDTFLYRASHDMRSPVCSIIGLCNIARQLSDGEPKELIDRVVNTTVGMDKLLKKLSLISEINQPTDFASFKLQNILADLKANFTSIISLHKIDFKVNCPENLDIDSYPNLVYTVLYNLIENAIYYSSIETNKQPTVQVDALSDGNSVEITVYDNGTGVDPTINDRLFDMFFKGTEKSKGHGLGLYIVDKAVQAMKGKIDVDSELGSYSRFRVTLPLHKQLPERILEATAVVVN
jgi:signal transduction histidine kinase